MTVRTSTVLLCFAWAVIAASAGISHPHVSDVPVIGEDEVTLLVANSDYVFWGTVEEATADTLHHFLLSLHVDSELLGRHDREYVDVLVGGYGFQQSNNPQAYEAGDRYLFFCFQSFDRSNESWHPGFTCGWSSVLQRSPANGELEFSGDSIDVRIQDLEASIMNAIVAASPASLFSQADLVLKARNVHVPLGSYVDTRCRLMRKLEASAEVVEIVKGEYDAREIRFKLDSGNEADGVPIISTDDDYLVFLRRTPEGYVLVKNDRGCLRIEGHSLVWNKEISTGCDLVAGVGVECN
jgi:hypothetical protein